MKNVAMFYVIRKSQYLLVSFLCSVKREYFLRHPVYETKPFFALAKLSDVILKTLRWTLWFSSSFTFMFNYVGNLYQNGCTLGVWFPPSSEPSILKKSSSTARCSRSSPRKKTLSPRNLGVKIASSAEPQLLVLKVL